MKLKVGMIGHGDVPTILELSHNNEMTQWRISIFDKEDFNVDYDFFKDINEYWARLPIGDQNEIFDIYKKIQIIFDTFTNLVDLIQQLHVLVAQLYQYHGIENIKNHMAFYSTVQLPEGGLYDTFEEIDDATITRERTYLKEDYKGVVALSVAMRPMLPIFGDFIAITRREVGTAFKEFYAYKLLAFSSIINSEPMNRLKNYVAKSIPADTSQSAAILNGISTEDFPIWILSMLVVRRLTIADVRGTNPRSALINVIYKYVFQKATNNDKSFKGTVRDKDGPTSNSTDPESNLSGLEGYKIKQEFSDGDLAIITKYIEDPHRVAKRICPTISLTMVDQCIKSTEVLLTGRILPFQVTLVQWILKRATPPRGVMYFTKRDIVKCIGVCQALLIHNKHYDLAGLIGASIHPSSHENTDWIEGRARITKEQMVLLDQLYPYSRRPSSKQKIARRVNPVIESIDKVESTISEYLWLLNMPEEHLSFITSNRNSRRYFVGYEIKLLIADLVIQLANGTFHN